MKYTNIRTSQSRAGVAPHPGAWIEMMPTCAMPTCAVVAPHPGAWIEISPACFRMDFSVVAPHPGAWIEIDVKTTLGIYTHCRTPPGCVD